MVLAIVLPVCVVVLFIFATITIFVLYPRKKRREYRKSFGVRSLVQANSTLEQSYLHLDERTCILANSVLGRTQINKDFTIASSVTSSAGWNFRKKMQSLHNFLEKHDCTVPQTEPLLYFIQFIGTA